MWQLPQETHTPVLFIKRARFRVFWTCREIWGLETPGQETQRARTGLAGEGLLTRGCVLGWEPAHIPIGQPSAGGPWVSHRAWCLLLVSRSALQCPKPSWGAHADGAVETKTGVSQMQVIYFPSIVSFTFCFQRATSRVPSALCAAWLCSAGSYECQRDLIPEPNTLPSQRCGSGLSARGGRGPSGRREGPGAADTPMNGGQSV